MTGRGRPRKAKSPDTKCAKTNSRPEEMKQASLRRCPVEDFSEEKYNGTTREQKLKERGKKTPNHTEEKPSVQSMRKEKTTKYFKEKINKPQSTPRDNPKPPVQGTSGETSAGKAKSKAESAEETTKMQPDTPKGMTKDSRKTTKSKKQSKSPEQLSEEMTKMQPETPKDTIKASVKSTKVKTCAGKTKSPDKFTETTTQIQPETPKDTIKASVKSTKVKTCAGKTKSPDKFTETTTQIQPETPKYTKNAYVTQDKCGDDAALDSILYTTLEKLKIKRSNRANAAEVINEIIKHIIKHLKENTECFKEVEEPLRTGSYYENVKISNPDEFDVMLPIPVDRVNVEQFGDDGAFYSVALKRGKSPLQRFQETDTLSASKMLDEFREEVKKCVKPFEEWVVTRKKKGCPAVTLTTEVQSVTISLDVVLCLMVKSNWPPFTREGLKIETWLGTKVRQEYKRKPYYLVPKYEGRGTVTNDGVLAKDVWRVSFSHIEKAILKNHGSEKTCCEKDGERCCRKDCLKLLKHLLSLLKEKDSQFDKFCSYHAKTTLLHACCSRTKDSSWRASSLSQCFQLLLKDFIGHLEKGVLHNFFIPSQNLLSGADQRRCNILARCIMEERDNGFPIFK